MDSLSYLTPYKKHIKWQELCRLKEEREAWWERESAKKWKVDNYPVFKKTSQEFHQPWVTLEGEAESAEGPEQLKDIAQSLIPWKKGPFRLFHLDIDAEWRSDYKWQRLEEHLPPLKGKAILDVGCNNGYFLYRMVPHDPALILGIDPVLHMQAQFDLIQHYAHCPQVHFELFGVEHLNLFHEVFDCIFHMGIIYHHRHPIQQLLDIREALQPGGTTFIETIGIPGEESYALFPEDRYGRMGNVWFVPTLSCLINWAKKAKLIDIEVIADTLLTEEEQRLTNWCPPPFQSLGASLKDDDPTQTIEGHPAPRRFIIKARKKSRR